TRNSEGRALRSGDATPPVAPVAGWEGADYRSAVPRPPTASRRPPGRAARVRVGVVNFNGGEMTLRCPRALAATDWPADALEIVLVDNASDDGVAARARAEMPNVHVVEHARNTGFSGGANSVMRDVRGLDYVALVNNDAVPEPDWLTHLGAALDAAAAGGAACPRIVFFPRSHTWRVEATATVPSGDAQARGARITGLTVAGVDAWEHAQFAAGCDVIASRGSGAE